MRKLFQAADNYIAACTWKDLALLKLCLFAFGFLAGGAVLTAKKLRDWQRPAIFAALSLFLATYLPLMARFITVGVLPLLPGRRDR